MQSKLTWPKQWQGIFVAFLIVGIGLVMTGCSSKQHHQSSQAQLTGIYQIDDTYRDMDDDGNEETDYLKFTKDGKVQMVTPETGDEHHGSYGSVDRGSYKHVKKNQFKVKIKDVYDHDYYEFTLIKENKRHLRTLSNHEGAYDWNSDSWTREKYMTAKDFDRMFAKAAESDQLKVQKNGYTDPDRIVLSNESGN